MDIFNIYAFPSSILAWDFFLDLRYEYSYWHSLVVTDHSDYILTFLARGPTRQSLTPRPWLGFFPFSATLGVCDERFRECQGRAPWRA
jgi:hypothetical protein